MQEDLEELGIQDQKPEAVVVKGKELYMNIDDQENDQIRKIDSFDLRVDDWCRFREVVFSDMLPKQKESIVKTCKNLNYTVAITGVPNNHYNIILGACLWNFCF